MNTSSDSAVLVVMFVLMVAIFGGALIWTSRRYLRQWFNDLFATPERTKGVLYAKFVGTLWTGPVWWIWPSVKLTLYEGHMKITTLCFWNFTLWYESIRAVRRTFFLSLPCVVLKVRHFPYFVAIFTADQDELIHHLETRCISLLPEQRTEARIQH